MTHLLKFCMFICFKLVLQLGKCCQGNFEFGLLQDAKIHDNNNTDQYGLGLQIVS